MKILVIDDNQVNLDNAVKQLGGEHEVVTCISYERAERLLTQSPIPSTEKSPYNAHSFKEGESMYDAVLTDLFMPPCFLGCSISKDIHENIEQPYGLVFMLTALRRGVKYLGLNSNANHHSSPMAWASEIFNGRFTIGSTKVIAHIGGGYIFYSDKDFKDGTKDWKKLLDNLLKMDTK